MCVCVCVCVRIYLYLHVVNMHTQVYIFANVNAYVRMWYIHVSMRSLRVGMHAFAFL